MITTHFKLKVRTFDLVYLCAECTGRDRIQMLGNSVILENSLYKKHLLVFGVKIVE